MVTRAANAPPSRLREIDDELLAESSTVRAGVGHIDAGRPQFLDFLFVPALKADQLVVRALVRLDQLVQLGLKRRTVAVLGRLEDRQEQQGEDIDCKVGAVDEKFAPARIGHHRAAREKQAQDHHQRLANEPCQMSRDAVEPWSHFSLHLFKSGECNAWPVPSLQRSLARLPTPLPSPNRPPMYARRFLGCVFLLTLLVVAGAFAIYEWGGHALISEAVPKGHFQPVKAGGAPDYTEASNWIARPGTPDDPSLWRPDGDASPDAKGLTANVFYIHPTTYLERDRWNAPLEPGGETEFRTRLFVQSQASAFNQSGRVWAPRYRQAAFGAFLLKSEDAEKALDFAYRDVAAAFDEFVKQVPQKGPIILAAHSQGALHLERLLKEKVAGQPISKRIVAAYVVGWPISSVADLPSLGLPACTAPDEAGCILSWMTFGEPANAGILLDEWKKARGLNGRARRPEDILCVNPITGAQGGAGEAKDNPGALVPTPDFRSATLQPGIIGARCDKGLLLLGGLPPPLGPFVLPGNNYHVNDYALFWGAIRRDAEQRLAAWHQ